MNAEFRKGERGAPASCWRCDGEASGLIEEFRTGDGRWTIVCLKCIREVRQKLIQDVLWADDDGIEYLGPKFPIVRASDELPLRIREELGL